MNGEVWAFTDRQAFDNNFCLHLLGHKTTKSERNCLTEERAKKKLNYTAKTKNYLHAAEDVKVAYLFQCSVLRPYPLHVF